MFSLSESSHPALADLLGHFIRTTYRSSSVNDFNKNVLSNAVALLNRDFAYVNIDNTNGHLCDSYPEVIPFLISEAIDVDASKLSDLLTKSKRARCRNRFVIPVITLGKRMFCRSSTLAASVEMLYRNGMDYIFGSKTAVDPSAPTSSQQLLTSRESFDNIRGADIQLLKFLGVSHIVDFMLENKKYKYGLKLTSSEKIDKEGRYDEFSLVVLPFPGVEHFSEWVDNGYIEDGLRFDWSQDFITAEMKIPTDLANRVHLPPYGDLVSNWCNVYQTWDTVKLTQSYVKLLLKLFLEESSGVLVHCISGWDRTPFFVSVVRLSLWADGAIHKSLNAAEMLYFTIAYDWFLFSHDLVDRGRNRQEIFRFCFSFLRHIEANEFSAFVLISNNENSLTPGSLKPSDSIPGLVTNDASTSQRKARLTLLRTLFENAYVSVITSPNLTSEAYQANNPSSLGQSLPNSLSSISRWLGSFSNGN